MTPAQIELQALQLLNEYLRDLVDILVLYEPRNRPPAMQRELDALLLRTRDRLPDRVASAAPGLAKLTTVLRSNASWNDSRAW